MRLALESSRGITECKALVCMLLRRLGAGLSSAEVWDEVAETLCPATRQFIEFASRTDIAEHNPAEGCKSYCRQ